MRHATVSGSAADSRRKFFVGVVRAPSARQNETANPSLSDAARRLARSRNVPPPRIGWYRFARFAPRRGRQHARRRSPRKNFFHARGPGMLTSPRVGKCATKTLRAHQFLKKSGNQTWQKPTFHRHFRVALIFARKIQRAKIFWLRRSSGGGDARRARRPGAAVTHKSI
jgi:hypothetical protein